jgi:hypothetical protein
VFAAYKPEGFSYGSLEGYLTARCYRRTLTAGPTPHAKAWSRASRQFERQRQIRPVHAGMSLLDLSIVTRDCKFIN